MPNSGRKMWMKKVKGIKKKLKNTPTTSRLLKSTKKLMSDHSPQPESTVLILIRISQFYNPEIDLNLLDRTGDRVPVLTEHPKPIKATAVKMNGSITAETETSITPKPTTNIAFIMDSLTKSPATSILQFWGITEIR